MSEFEQECSSSRPARLRLSGGEEGGHYGQTLNNWVEKIVL